jgi:hypothetical protein
LGAVARSDAAHQVSLYPSPPALGNCCASSPIHAVQPLFVNFCDSRLGCRDYLHAADKGRTTMIRLFKHYIPNAVLLLGLLDIVGLVLAGEIGNSSRIWGRNSITMPSATW